ncbi:MAG TPA: respiratory nitrate reductase subunit gamma [Spirochaetia bacterium]|nr:respiratory nitrate reductase subunit gamma [Spirochaetia bacterium]
MPQILALLLYGYYPYVAVTVFVAGNIIRFNRGQYGWRSGSSQLLRRRQLLVGSTLFHYGVLVVLAGHLVGFATPDAVLTVLGVSVRAHQMLAVVAGGTSGTLAWIGLTMLVHRRLFDSRIRKTSSVMDIVSLLLVWTQLTLGLVTVPLTLHHMDGALFLQLVAYVQSIIYFRPDAVSLIQGVPGIYLAHIFLGFTFFLVWPFSRLVHIWSAPIWYIGRAYQVVRRRVPARARRGMPS